MEKYSAYRDPGTGVQPFLTPVSPPSPQSNLLIRLVSPFGYLIGALRTTLVLSLLVIYLLLLEGACLVLLPLPPLYRITTHLLTSTIARLVLLLVGFIRIPVECVTRKRGRSSKSNEVWNPQAGDLIVSNWVSWIELLWLAFRFNPIFVIPLTESIVSPALQPSEPTAHLPGRRVDARSANVPSSSGPFNTRIPVLGFRRISLLSAICHTGQVPPYELRTSELEPISLEEIRREADRPLVIFPECTTSNGRGLLRFSNIFTHESVPVRKYQVFVMCVRCDLPGPLSPTPTHSIPSTFLNPLPHLFTLTTSLITPAFSIRLLAPSESPSSPLFSVSEFTSKKENQLGEVCAALISQIGKVKRMSVGWEDKSVFLDFYRERRS